MFTVTLHIGMDWIETSDGHGCNLWDGQRYIVETIDPGVQPSKWFITDGMETVEVTMRDFMRYCRLY